MGMEGWNWKYPQLWGWEVPVHWDVCYLCKPRISHFFPFLKFRSEWQLEVNINNAVTIQNTEHFENENFIFEISRAFCLLRWSKCRGVQSHSLVLCCFCVLQIVDLYFFVINFLDSPTINHLCISPECAHIFFFPFPFSSPFWGLLHVFYLFGWVFLYMLPLILKLSVALVRECLFANLPVEWPVKRGFLHTGLMPSPGRGKPVEYKLSLLFWSFQNMGNTWLSPWHPAGVLWLEDGVKGLNVWHQPNCQLRALVDLVWKFALEMCSAESSES